MSYQNWGLDEYRGGWDFGGQERRDQAATLALFHAKRGVRNLSYCLYLRPFGSVNRLTAQSAPMEVVGSRYLGPSGSVLGTRPLRLTQRLRRVSHLRRVINELRPL
jgi:hypothetical protein